MFVDRGWLEDELASGKSYEQIGREIGRDGSTVSWWAKRFGLTSQRAHRFRPKGAPDRELLEQLAAEGATLSETAAALERSLSTVRYWLDRWGIERKRRPTKRWAGAGQLSSDALMECRRHGRTAFRLEGRGYYRCKRCRQDAVAKRRRNVKQILVEEAGGACVLCGYDRTPVALQFHHLDRTTKAFALSRQGVTRNIEESRAEAAKCVLLCANCHSEVEAGYAVLDAG